MKIVTFDSDTRNQTIDSNPHIYLKHKLPSNPWQQNCRYPAPLQSDTFQQAGECVLLSTNFGHFVSNWFPIPKQRRWTSNKDSSVFYAAWLFTMSNGTSSRLIREIGRILISESISPLTEVFRREIDLFSLILSLGFWVGLWGFGKCY